MALNTTPSSNTIVRRGLTIRSVLLTFFLIPLNSFWLLQQETVHYTFPTWLAPISNVIFIVVGLMLINKIWGKLSGCVFLDQSEFLIVYFLLSVSSCICSDKIGHHLVEFMVHAQWFADQENEWMQLFGNYLPRWALVNDQKAIRFYYEGGTTVYQLDILRAWITPMLLWVGFLVIIMFVLLCLNTFLRQQWVEKEKLTYPVIQLPLQMTNPKMMFFRNRFMWIGFGIAAFISLANGLHSLYPQFPFIPVKRRSFGYLFTSRPWNAMGDIRLSFYPFLVGLTFLVPLDVLLSGWVFYLGYKVQLIIKALAGWHHFPSYDHQSFGAYFAIALFTIWLGRHQFLLIFRRGFGFGDNKKHLEESSEMIGYQFAFWGMVAGLAGLVFFSHELGMSIWVAVIYFLIYLVLAMVVARLRAEMGSLVHDFAAIDPDHFLTTVLGTSRLRATDLTGFTIYGFFNQAYMSHPMPHLLEGLKIAERTCISTKRIPVAVLLVTGVATLTTFWLMMHQYYSIGASSGYFGPFPGGMVAYLYRRLQHWLTYPVPPDYMGIGYMAGGFFLGSLIYWMRMRFIWWPFHPLGYAMANSWAMNNFWSCLFIAFVVKWIILRFIGLGAYRKALPFFLGLAFGDFIIGSIWSLIGITLGIQTYEFWP